MLVEWPSISRMSGFVFGSGPLRVRVRVRFVFGLVSGFASGVRVRFVSGFVSRFVSGSCLVSVWVRVEFVFGFVSGSYPLRVWFVSGWSYS